MVSDGLVMTETGTPTGLVKPQPTQKAPNSTRRRGRPPSNAALSVDEDRLLAAVFKMFSMRGYDATLLRELSRELGVSHNLLNVRFGKKRDIWMAAVDWRFARASQNVIAAFEGTGGPEERLRSLIARFCEWAVVNPDVMSLSYWEGQEASWRLDHIVDEFIAPFKLRLDALLEELRLERADHQISTPAVMAMLVQGVGFYFAARPLQEKLGDEKNLSEEHQLAQARILGDFITSGLLSRG